MEPANLHPQQHQLQEQFTGYYSSLLSQPHYSVSSTSNLRPGVLLESWPLSWASMSQGLSFCDATVYTQPSAHEYLRGKIKDEMPVCFPKLSESTYCPSNVEESHYLSPIYKQQYFHDINENHWLSNFSSGHHVKEQLSAGDTFSSNAENSASLQASLSASEICGFSHFLPNINIPTSDLCFPSLFPSSLDLNSQAVNLLTPPCDAAKSSQSSHNSFSHFMQELKIGQSKSSNKTSVSDNGVGRKKRHSSFSESKKRLPEAKKHRSMSQTSCPPLKVRTENLRDRIAALQRLVAPYGKTDTASVLTEAIGYIQFLHDQVQTLSVPYLKSSKSGPIKTTQASSSMGNGKGQPKMDLRNRGLCLVPLSCASSYFSSYDSSI